MASTTHLRDDYARNARPYCSIIVRRAGGSTLDDRLAFFPIVPSCDDSPEGSSFHLRALRFFFETCGSCFIVLLVFTPRKICGTLQYKYND